MLIDLEQIIEQLDRAENLVELERQSGVTRATMYNILRGSDPRWSTLVRLQRYFDKCAKKC